LERIPNQVYTEAFRIEAVRLVLENGLPLAEAARQVAIPKGTLSTWVDKAREHGSDALKSHGKPLSDILVENKRLKRELAEARMERDILKKATAYFAKELMPGTRP
jgi:transposase